MSKKKLINENSMFRRDDKGYSPNVRDGETGKDYGQPGVPDYWGVEDDVSNLDKYITPKDVYNGFGSISEEKIDGDEDLDEIPLSSIDMPIKDKGIFSAMAAGENEEDFEGDNYDEYFSENKVIKLTIDGLQKLIKEGVAKIHKQTLIESRLKEIDRELNKFKNPQVKEDLISEISFRDVQSMIPVATPKDTATIESNNKWTKIQKESISEIMGHASELMAVAKRKYENISK